MAAASKKLIEVYVDLLNLLECPVCFRYASSNEAPIKICTEGHFICGDCGRSLYTCPTCRCEYSNVRPTILDQIIEALAYPCCKVGCGTLLPLKDIHSHELRCSFQEDEEMKCDKNMVQSQNILKHIEENYSSFYLKPGDDVAELGLCMNCLSVAIFSEDDDISSTNRFDNNQESKQNLSKTEVCFFFLVCMI
ncbi:unnamed protein product [Nezara viridula]|uniref:RING-type domain-containing protein n=1 Tax=Nezara viridula TaxID=85310 RepID=A0A9P0H1C8_NEZVI|nr:unnamed protein product [Nezara viridula]